MIIVSIRVQATCVLIVTNPEMKAQNSQNFASSGVPSLVVSTWAACAARWTTSPAMSVFSIPGNASSLDTRAGWLLRRSMKFHFGDRQAS